MMKQVTTIGLDIAKSAFLVYADAAGHVVLLQKLSRSRAMEFFAKLPRCLGWHRGVRLVTLCWARELITQGHELKQMSA
jgi:transposase